MSARRVRRDQRRRRRRHIALATAFVAVVLVTFAWAMFTGGPDDPEPEPIAQTTTTLPEPEGPRVIDPGAEPRQVLRLAFVEGEQVSFMVVTDLAVSQTAHGGVKEVDVPAMIQTMTMTVDRVHPGGTEADISFLVTGSSAYPEDRFSQETLDELDLRLASLVGVGGSGRIADTGEVLSFDYRYDGTDPTVTSTLDQLAGQLETLTPSFPTEPLGVGARWEVTTTARLSGVAFSQVTTYELTAMADGAAEFTSTVTQTADPQDLDLPEAEQARLLSYSATGSGTGRFSLDSLVASGTTSTEGTQVVVLTPPGGSEVELTQELSLALIVEVTG